MAYPTFPVFANQNVQCQIFKKIDHSTSNYMEQGNFTYVVGTVVHTNTYNEIDADDS